jgi:hypothetical protein
MHLQFAQSDGTIADRILQHSELLLQVIFP